MDKRKHCKLFESGIDSDGNFCRSAPICNCGDDSVNNNRGAFEKELLNNWGTIYHHFDGFLYGDNKWNYRNHTVNALWIIWQAAEDEFTGHAEPAAYLYKFVDPLSGRPIWRHNSGPWNCQSPTETKPLYEHPSKLAKDSDARNFVKKAKFDLLVAEAKRIEDMQFEMIQKLRDDLRTAYIHQNPNEADSIWYWQGDGYDHIDSLVDEVVVVIRADQMRALLASQQSCDGLIDERIDALEVQLSEALAMIDELQEK